jgi:hypothetical protein
MKKLLYFLLVIIHCVVLLNCKKPEINIETVPPSQSIGRTYNGIVNDDAVRIRAEPSLEGAIAGRLDQGMSVEVHGRSQDRMFLDGYDSYWLKISKDNIEGWVYGAYINLVDLQYSQLPVLSTVKQAGKINLNYTLQNMVEQDWIQKEKETLRLQSPRFAVCSIEDYYKSIVNVFNRKQSLRPFFLNTQMVGHSFRSQFFYYSASVMCDYIQTSYSDNLSISPLYMNSETSGTFLIYGFKKMPEFQDVEIATMLINIKKTGNGTFGPLGGKTVIDFITLNPYTEEEQKIVFSWVTDYYLDMVSAPVYKDPSPLLQMFLDDGIKLPTGDY